jgi:hypothetical protein
MRVRLTRKFAERIDGVDLKAHEVGDVIDLPLSEGRLLIAERWAIVERRREERLSSHSISSVSQDYPGRRSADAADAARQRPAKERRRETP